MGRTIIGVNDAKAVKRYSSLLAIDTPKESYWGPRFTGEGETARLPIQRLTELEQDAGELITFDLSVQLKQQPIEGDDTQEGTEEDLNFYSDQVYIDQQRGGVNSGGRMTRKRTLRKLRDIARVRQAEWWARLMDEIRFIYMSGARGVNTGFIMGTSWTGRANNSFTAPDSNHLMLPRLSGGTMAVKATLTTAETMKIGLVDRLVASAGTMGGGTEEVPRIQPIRIDGEVRYVLVMHKWQEYDLRADTGTLGWTDLQKSMATAVGKESPIFKGGLGMYNNVVLHSHENVIRFTDYGASSPAVLPAARALFLGVQALVEAYGSPGTNQRFDWYEESRDNGNQVVISTSCIWGCKKVTFNGLDYGVIALDTYAKNPNT
jgi:N4-gp56 family major capsid protein